MNRLSQARANRQRRAKRSRRQITTSSQRPRLSVNISNRQVRAQIIDDTTGRTLASATSLSQDLNQPLTDKAALVGQAIAKAAAAVKVKQVVLDRGSKIYHGRLKALAEAARKQGLEF